MRQRIPEEHKQKLVQTSERKHYLYRKNLPKTLRAQDVFLTHTSTLTRTSAINVIVIDASAEISTQANIDLTSLK